MIVSLKDGTRILMRHIRPEDKPLLVVGHGRLSPETIRRRFLASKPRLSSTDLRYLTEVDSWDHVALVAVLADEPDTLVGVGRFIRDVDVRDEAEFAIVVADPLQGQGLGTQLAQRLAAEARIRGIRRFTATALSDNVVIRSLVEHISNGLRAEHHGGVQTMVADIAA